MKIKISLLILFACAALTACETASSLVDLGSAINDLGAGPTDAERKKWKAECMEKLSNIPPTRWGKVNPDYEYQRKKCEGMK